MSTPAKKPAKKKKTTRKSRSTVPTTSLQRPDDSPYSGPTTSRSTARLPYSDRTDHGQQ